MKKIINILLFLSIFTSLLYSQTEQEIDESVQLGDSVYVMTKSPLGAVLRSALIPGWGQVYNESYWKAPIVWGFLGYFAYYWIDNNNMYIKYSDLYKESYAIGGLGNQTYLSNRDFYRDQRDEFAVYILLTYLLNLVDAYVDAHLFDFDVTENPMTRTPQMGIKIHF